MKIREIKGKSTKADIVNETPLIMKRSSINNRIRKLNLLRPITIITLLVFVLVCGFAGSSAAAPVDWGRTVADSSNTDVQWTRAMGGISPNVDGMMLKSVSIYVGNLHTSQVRVAVYQGGNLSSGPDGATLLCDAGTTSGNATNQFLTLTCSDTLILKNTPVWIAVKGNDSNFRVHYSPSNTNAGDFQTSDGRFQSADVSTNENTGYPDTWPSDGGTFSNYWYSFYLTWEVSSCTDGTASTITIPSSQTVQGDPYDASTMFNASGNVGNFEYKVTTAGSADQLDWGKTNVGVSSTNVNWVRVSNGNAPSSAGMNLKSVSIYVESNHADQVRLAVYSGGSLTTGPTGATLLHDFGITSGNGTNQWLTLPYSGPDIEVPADQPIWIAFKGNSGGNGFDVRYSTSASGTDFETSHGRWQSAVVSNNENDGYNLADPWPADNNGSFRNYWYSTYITYEAGGTTVCSPWTSNTSIPAYAVNGSGCGDYNDGGTYTLDVRGTDPDCGDIITATEKNFTWEECLANTTDDLSETFLESYEVSLTWSFECTDNEYYKVYRDGSFLANVIPCDGTYTDATVSADTDYTYTVRGYSSDEPCESEDSNTINIHTPVYEPQTTPGIAAAAPADESIYVSARYTNDSNKNNTLLVEWGYDQVNFSLGSAAIPNGQTPYMYLISGLTNGTAYQVKITYIDSDGFTGGDNVQIITHVVPAVWSDDSMLHNSNRFDNSYWDDNWGLPGGEYGGFTCETCHEINTTNIKRVKESITAPAGGFPGAEVVFSETGAGGFGDDTSTYTSSQKICEVCHSKTLYHRFNSPTARLHESEPAMNDCTLCHPHNEGFKPDGACTICHAISMGDRVAVMGQFNSDSHHIQGVTVDGTHCYECHWEANADGSVNTTYHGGSLDPGSAVDLIIYGFGTRPVNYSVGSTAVRYTTDGSRTQILEMNQHCISCHNTENNNTQPFNDGNTPNEYSWDGTCTNPTYNARRDDCIADGGPGAWTKGTSINERYAPETTTTWGKYNVANTNGKMAMTKAHSSHGVAAVNEQGFDLNDTWPDTSGYNNVACYDCHNSHGSDVAGTTTSYNSDATKGGNLKSTIAGKGGYQMTYKPVAGGSAGNNNVHAAGAALCFDCHETLEAGTKPWGYQGTYGATQPIRGYLDTPYFGAGLTGPQQSYGYKASSGANKGGHLDASAPLATTVNGSINGLCTPCHDPHGVSPTLDQDYAVPMLKGTWMTSPYKEDVAPSATNECVGGSSGRSGPSQWCGSSTPGYYIDQNTFTSWSYTSTASVSESDNQFAGLCMGCHPKSSLSPDSTSAWRSVDRIHNSVKGWDTDGNTKHRFTCSKCHSPHNSALPRLMVTNCLDDNHRGQRATGGSAGSHSGSGGGGWGGSGSGSGRFPAGGQGSGSDPINPGPHHFGNRTCHDSTNGDGWPNNQRWNNVSQW